MQEKDKNASTVDFLTVYGPKKSSNEHFNPEDDCTDQRAPVNNPSELYEQFFMNDEDFRAEIAAQLDEENIDDFDNDVYDYEDRSELGEDIALARSIDLSKNRPSSKKELPGPKESKDEESSGDE